MKGTRGTGREGRVGYTKIATRGVSHIRVSVVDRIILQPHIPFAVDAQRADSNALEELLPLQA